MYNGNWPSTGNKKGTRKFKSYCDSLPRRCIITSVSLRLRLSLCLCRLSGLSMRGLCLGLGLGHSLSCLLRIPRVLMRVHRRLRLHILLLLLLLRRRHLWVRMRVRIVVRWRCHSTRGRVDAVWNRGNSAGEVRVVEGVFRADALGGVELEKTLKEVDRWNRKYVKMRRVYIRETSTLGRCLGKDLLEG